MSVDDAITSGTGQYPRITMMVEWLEELKDTLMSRSDLIRLAGQARVDQDLQNHLSYRKMMKFEGRRVLIMSQTEAGLLNEEMKAMQRIKNDQFKVTKAAQTTVDQPGVLQSGIAQSGFAQPGIAQAVVGQPAITQPAVTQGATQGATQGVTQGVTQSAVTQPAVTQGVTQSGISQSETTQSGVAQSNQADMISSAAVQAMIVSAVQQTIQQYQRQSATSVTA
ncbi:MAG: hypothetical protein Q9191_006239 [Dirinaria sp. TL-2023a]